ncbi:MAG: mechanosensitive ion channel [Myxococcales bacterium]|nr:mechanosensitive ion channel [Myxococcales bacterium]
MNKFEYYLNTYGVKVIGVAVALWLAFQGAGWLQTRITKGLQAKNFDATLSIFFGKLVRWGVIVATVLSCLGVFGVQTTSFAAVIGAAGLAIGLAFQGTLSNFSAGVMLLVFRPFKVGDLINAAGSLGVVAEIGLFTVALDTLDNRRIIIPNSSVTAGTIENISANEYRRVDVDVGTDYGADLKQTRDVLEQVCANVAGRDAEKGHQVFLSALGASSIDWQLRVWCKADVYWDVWQALTHDAKVALDAAGIGIPFPQMDVHLDKLDA